MTDTITVDSKKLLAMMQEAFESGKTFELLVTGYSMKPLLRNLRDRVVLVSPERRKPKQGDIVFCVRKNGSCVLHRVIRVQPNGMFVINGDAQDWEESVHYSQVMAVVSAIWRDRHYIACDSKNYKRYVYLWTKCRGLRSVMIKVVVFLKRFTGKEQSVRK